MIYLSMKFLGFLLLLVGFRDCLAADYGQTLLTTPPHFTEAPTVAPYATMYRGIVVGSVLGFPILLIVTFVVVIFCCRERKRRLFRKRGRRNPKAQRLSPAKEESVAMSNSKRYSRPAATNQSQGQPLENLQEVISEIVEEPLVLAPRVAQMSKTPSMKNFIEIDEDLIDLGAKIGEGAVSDVYKASYRESNKNLASRVVAIKMAKPGENFAENRIFLEKQLTALSLVDKPHPYIIELIGAVTVSPGRFLVVVEHCGFGNLQEFLRSQRNAVFAKSIDLTPCDLAMISSKIAQGMKFLSETKSLHIDLMASKILLTTDRTPKIAGFNLSQQCRNEFKKIPKEPWQWKAPEVLSEANPYLHKSADVWSFGVLLWEIFSLGQTPYSELTVMPSDFVTQLKHKHKRLPKPELAPDGIYKIMLSCWSYISFDRPSFPALSKQLSSLCSSQSPATTLKSPDNNN